MTRKSLFFLNPSNGGGRLGLGGREVLVRCQKQSCVLDMPLVGMLIKIIYRGKVDMGPLGVLISSAF